MKKSILMGFLIALVTCAFTVGASHDDRPPKKAGYTVENQFKSDIHVAQAVNVDTANVTSFAYNRLPGSGRLCTWAEVETKFENPENPVTLFEVRPHSKDALVKYKSYLTGYMQPPDRDKIKRSIPTRCRTADC